ncbi:MAG TPA: hypothetical protein VF749_09760, partial [Candidatus Acidoferrum sp.]
MKGSSDRHDFLVVKAAEIVARTKNYRGGGVRSQGDQPKRPKQGDEAATVSWGQAPNVITRYNLARM